MPREEGLGSLNIYTILTYGGFLARQHFPSNDDSKFSIRSLTRRPLSLSYLTLHTIGATSFEGLVRG